MSTSMWGIVLGVGVAVGVLLLLSAAAAARRPAFEVRVLPYLRDLPEMGRRVREREASSVPGLASLLVGGADLVERVLGGAASVRRRLERADLPLTVHDFRVQQVQWGLIGLAVTAIPSLVLALRSPERSVPLAVLCVVAFAVGVLLRENRLTAQVRDRERRVLEEFPAVAELLSLAVAAGESPAAALDRIVRRTHGELSHDLQRVLAEVRTGTPLARAFDDLAARTGLPVVARFAEGLAIAVERGTPLADVLHAQSGDVREASRRALIESGARREVLMMVPVVFLVLPVTVVFAFWPGLVGLRLVTP